MARSKYYHFNHELKPPYRIEKLDQFHGRHEAVDGIDVNYDDMDEAVKVACQITDDAIKECGSIDKWKGVGIAALVYDSQGYLVWHGVYENTRMKFK